MPKNENQHYVPRLYLRNFANNKGLINILNLNGYKILKEKPYKSQCQEDLFYGKDLIMEHLLERIENNAKTQIKSIVETSTIDFENEPYLDLLYFIATQSIRTRIATDSILENVNAQIDAIIEKLAEIGTKNSNKYIGKLKAGNHNPRALITLASFSVPYLLLDLLCTVIENEFSIDFITSDNPVCLYNQYLNNLQNCTGIKEVFSSKGLIMLYPITYKKLLLLFDPSVYEIESWEPVMKVDNAPDIMKINICQCVNANEVIFFSNSIHFNDINNWAKEVRKSYKMKYGIYKSVTNNNTGKTSYNVEISFIKLLKCTICL